MSTIVTLTMNPALDVSTDADLVAPGEKIRCGPTTLDPGGGGVNVSRVVHRLGGDTVAVYAAGGLTGDLYSQLLENEQVALRRIRIGGETRESFTVTENRTGEQYRFVLEGPRLTSDEEASVFTVVDEVTKPGDWLVVSGSLPPGVPDDFYGQLARHGMSRGLTVVVDAAPPWFGPAVDSGVFLVKPSRHELEEYVGVELGDRQSQIDAARDIISQAGVTYVAVSLGREGAVLVSADHAWHAVAPHVTAVSTVGAGDSFLAGIVWSLHGGQSPNVALAYGVAAGSATAMSPATALCDKASVERVLADVVTTTLGL